MRVAITPSLRLVRSRRTTEEERNFFLNFQPLNNLYETIQQKHYGLSVLLTVVLEDPGCMDQGCMGPLVPQGVQEGQGDHVGLDLHGDQVGHEDHPLE